MAADKVARHMLLEDLDIIPRRTSIGCDFLLTKDTHVTLGRSDSDLLTDQTHAEKTDFLGSLNSG